MRSNFIIPSSDITEDVNYNPVYHSDINYGSRVTIAYGKYKAKKGVAIGVTPKKIRVWLGPFNRDDSNAGPANFFREQLIIVQHERDVPSTPPRAAADDPVVTPRSNQQNVPDEVRSDEVRSDADDFSFVDNAERYEDALNMTDMKIALICIERCMHTHDIAIGDKTFLEYVHNKLVCEAPHDPSLRSERKKGG